MNTSSVFFCTIVLLTFISCQDSTKQVDNFREITVSKNGRYLAFETGQPFFWLGGTSWGMSEWLNRGDVDYYLDNRQQKEFNVVQICLFWGKREDDPLKFTTNPVNAYGFRPFKIVDGKPDPSRPDVVEGGTPTNPNDYWDHVDYIIKAAKKRNMFVAILPVWGRRYVNNEFQIYGESVFSVDDMYEYGRFLGDRYRTDSNLIWVLGGDVPADLGGDFLLHYRRMAEGIIYGITNEKVRWDQQSELWDHAFMTYHPDGTPSKNSSTWFHEDPWLDFNMIETWQHRDSVRKAVTADYNIKDPIKPTVMGEPAYEGDNGPGRMLTGVHMRRQAYQTFFSGGVGFTYGCYRDTENGYGPLFSPYKGWKKLLNLEGANSMKFVKKFALKHDWPNWEPLEEFILDGEGQGEFQNVAILNSLGQYMVYFPDRSKIIIQLQNVFDSHQATCVWYNPKNGEYSKSFQVKVIESAIEFLPPENWTDAVLIVE